MIMSYKKKFPWGAPTDFKQKILDGTKKHTFREDQHGRWSAGKHIHHAQGVRTKNYDCFLENDCVSTQSVIIANKENIRCLEVDNTLLYWKTKGYEKYEIGAYYMQILAKNDGFDSVEDFFKWFNKDFYGFIIHWTDLRY